MKILHLYYDLMNLYGEYGNVECIKRHLEDQGFNVIVDKLTVNNRINFLDYDFIYCGSGLESNQKVVLKDLLKHKKSLLEAIQNNRHILFTGNAMELLGQKIDEEEALGIFPITTNHMPNKRYTGDVVVKCDEFGEVVGFINKSSIVVQGTNGLFSYVFKDENLNDQSVVEGYKVNNLIGTHIIGPILVKNPSIMRYYVEGIGKSIKPNYKYKNKDYPYENDSYNVTLKALKQRIKK